MAPLTESDFLCFQMRLWAGVRRETGLALRLAFCALFKALDDADDLGWRAELAAPAARRSGTGSSPRIVTTTSEMKARGRR